VVLEKGRSDDAIKKKHGKKKEADKGRSEEGKVKRAKEKAARLNRDEKESDRLPKEGKKVYEEGLG